MAMPRRFLETWSRTALGRGLVLAVVLAPAAACRAGHGAPAAAPAVPVKAAKALQATIPAQIEAVGRVEPISQVAVKAQVGGELTRVWFVEGQTVRTGEPILTIDPRPFEAAVEAAEARLARDQALAHKAELDAGRCAKLLAEQLVTDEQCDQTTANLRSLQATIAADRADLNSARLQLSYCAIASPLSGRTGALTVKQGNVVKANDDQPLVTISQIRPIAAAFSVPARWLGAIARRRGQEIRVVATPDEGATRFEGTLSFVDNAVDPATGTVLLKARFANEEEGLWPGEFVQVTLTLGEEAGRVVAPAPAVQSGQQGQYVFVVKADQTVELRTVTVGQMDEREAVIDDGLAAGETVVTEGHLRLVPGSRVDVRPSAGS